LNGTKTLTATVLPHYSAQGVMWESDDTAVATVDKNGKVTAKGIGKATIRAISVTANEIFAESEVRVVSEDIFNNGALINEIIWATRNVDAPGTFAANPQDAGMLFQWNRRTGWATTGDAAPEGWNSSTPEGSTWEAVNDPCPEGWRVPTQAELESLNDAGSFWHTNWNNTGVRGRLFGSASNQLFLPAAGNRSTTGLLGTVGDWGFYWSSTQSGTNNAMRLWFSSSFSWVNASSCTSGQSVRCVSK
jgi:uncharacterized protein (TIGR02145 family)